MAEIAPMAEWRPLPRAMSTTPLQHDIVCLHTMVGTLAGSWSWSSRAGGSYWHFGCGGSGALWQCQDLRYKSAANLYGNWRVIPIETEDMGAWFPAWGSSCGNVPWWTDAQINKIVSLVAWLCARYDIPPVLIPDTLPGRRGIAYHRQGIDPNRVSGGEKWSNATGKCCPDWRRIRQLTEAVVPRVQAVLGGAPAPEPEPEPIKDEEDMARIIRHPNGSHYYVGTAGSVVKLGSGTTAAAFEDAKGGVVTLPKESWADGDAIVAAEREASAALLKLNPIDLRVAALGQYADRAEQRDLAGS